MSHSVVKLIDHAVLQPTQTADDVRAACHLCRELLPASLCVKPADVSLAAELLAGSRVLVSTVIGFPHGGTSTAAKVAEAEIACLAGARELDMVANLGRVFSGEWVQVQNDIAAVVEAGKGQGVIVKVILETGLLPNDEMKTRLAQACVAAGAAFVKTSTGFGMVRSSDGNCQATGATEHDVRLLRSLCPPEVGVKASGGIRSLADAQRMIAAGANRLGTSATATIAQELLGSTAAHSAAGY